MVLISRVLIEGTKKQFRNLKSLADMCSLTIFFLRTLDILNFKTLDSLNFLKTCALLQYPAIYPTPYVAKKTVFHHLTPTCGRDRARTCDLMCVKHVL